jgi:hypothetical protein
MLNWNKTNISFYTKEHLAMKFQILKILAQINPRDERVLHVDLSDVNKRFNDAGIEVIEVNALKALTERNANGK